MANVIVDTGPLLSYFDRNSQHHSWVVSQLKEVTGQLLTCEAVLAETIFLMQCDGLNPEWVLHLVERGELLCGFDLTGEIPTVRRLLRQYRNLRPSLANVCLVRMSELNSNRVVMTFDRDFLLYRRNGRQKIPLLAPFV